MSETDGVTEIDWKKRAERLEQLLLFCLKCEFAIQDCPWMRAWSDGTLLPRLLLATESGPVRKGYVMRRFWVCEACAARLQLSVVGDPIGDAGIRAGTYEMPW